MSQILYDGILRFLSEVDLNATKLVDYGLRREIVSSYMGVRVVLVVPNELFNKRNEIDKGKLKDFCNYKFSNRYEQFKGDIDFSVRYGYEFMDETGVIDIGLYKHCLDAVGLREHDFFKHFTDLELKLLPLENGDDILNQKKKVELENVYNQMPIELVQMIGEYM